MEAGCYSESTVGAPQGGVISLLLSNIYLNYLDSYWARRFTHLGELVRNADDFVILCKKKAQVEEALQAVRWIMQKLELTMHNEKTRLEKKVLIFLVSIIDSKGAEIKVGNGIGHCIRHRQLSL